MPISAMGRNRLSKLNGLVERRFGSMVMAGHVNAETIKINAANRGMCLWSAIFFEFLPAFNA